MHSSNYYLMIFPSNFEVSNEMLVISLIRINNVLIGCFINFNQFFVSFSIVLLPVGGTSSISEAFFQLRFFFISHSSEEPVVEAFSGSSLVLWLFTSLLISWGNSISVINLSFHEWGKGLRHTDIFLNSHLGVGFNNIITEKNSISFLEFVVYFTPFLHCFSGLIEFFGVEGDVSNDWDLSEGSNGHC